MAVWLATAAFGLEGVVKDELSALGLKARAETGGARFEGGWDAAFLANLHLRSADRVAMVLMEETCTTFDQLFRAVFALPWDEILPADACFPVTGHCARSQLMSVSDCQSITKKAIVEKLKQKYRLPWFEEKGAVYPLQITLHGDVARLTLNTSGDALNRRGYRTWNGEAPIRETLAAAMVGLSGWRGTRPLHDPMCGTGTLLVEAALRAARRAPGLKRSFAMEIWRGVDHDMLRRIRHEAEKMTDDSLIPPISGSDTDPKALALAQKHIRQAGLEGHIMVFQKDLRELSLPNENLQFITNPPYGERLGDRKTAEKIYRDLGALTRRHPGSHLTVITAHQGFERCYGKAAYKKRRLYNGRLECELLIY